MHDSDEELAAVAPYVEVANVKLVHLLGTRAVQPQVRAVLIRLAIDSRRLGDPDSPTPILSPRAALETPQGRKTTPSSPAARRGRGR